MSITLRSPLAVALAALLGVVGSGCDLGVGGNKAGGASATAELRLAVASGADDGSAPLARSSPRGRDARRANSGGGSLPSRSCRIACDIRSA
jgi:hypothetical protein